MKTIGTFAFSKKQEQMPNIAQRLHEVELVADEKSCLKNLTLSFGQSVGEPFFRLDVAAAGHI